MYTNLHGVITQKNGSSVSTVVIASNVEYPYSDYRQNPPWCMTPYTCLLRDWQPWTVAMFSSLPTCLANWNNHGTTGSVCTTTSMRWVSAPRHICHVPHINVYGSTQCQISASSFRPKPA